jgi:GT2 family glycosyltransferase
MDVSIIIINYKTFQLTCQCIESVLHYTKGLRFEIVLVENGTAEFNKENTKHWGEQVKLICSDDNLGFAGGNNLGIKHAVGEYILLLNSDTYLVEDSISQSVQYLSQHPEIGVISAKLIYPDGRHQSVAQRFPSIKYSLIELFRLQKLMSRAKAGQLLLGSFFAHDEIVEADWVWGAFFLTRKLIIEQLPQQRLNEDYFMYWEDVQWCMDIKRLGYRIFYYPDTKLVHIHEGSKGDKNELMEKNKKLFFKNNYSSVEIKIINLLNKCLSL